ncbi:type VI secretion system Vgr family protein [Hymenobacter terrenus]|uniref:type VI secretion system Vgr family protein n=1 Tax=Hymenobacter terrenus TaxID=1629124 RepID=UPI0006196B24|nr:contractile injection system protein, VgrG/Pvc8 family [Hymenobacter terrenus]
MPRPVSTTVSCNNAVLCPSYDIQQVSLSQNVFGHHKFEVLLPFDQVESATAPFFTDAHTRLLGQPLTIRLEADGFHFFNGEQQLLFQGVVTHLNTGKDNEFAGSVVVSGYSPCQLLASGRKKRTFVNQTMATIFNKVLKPFPANMLARDIAPLYRKPLPYAVQYQETDFDFLSRLAAEYGEWFYYDGRTLRLGTPGPSEEVDFWADGRYNTFRFGMTLQPAKERLTGYNYQKNEHFQRTTERQQVAGLQGTSFAGYTLPFVQHALNQSEKLYDEAHRVSNRIAQGSSELDAEALRQKSSTVASLVTVQGTSDNLHLQVGRVLNIRSEGVGSRHNAPESFGKYRITAITHTIDAKGNYSNVFTAIPFQAQIPPANPDAVERILVGNPELAEVIDDNDPARLGRLRVRYYWPVQDQQDAETSWIRGVTPYSGDGKGQMFNPEIGSQVLVAYEDGMAEQPFVVGNMVHGNNRQGASYSRTNNHVKGIQSKAGNKLTFNDMTGAMQMLLSNSNNKGTAMQLGFDGAGNVTIKTLGPVHVSGSSITLEAGPLGEINMHARRITMQAEEEIVAHSITKDILLVAKETLAYQAKEVMGKAEEIMHLDGGQKLTADSSDSYYL